MYAAHLPADTLDDDRIDAVRSEFARWLAGVEDLVAKSKADVDSYNSQLSAEVRAALKRRADKLTHDDRLARSIGVPLRQRPGAEAIRVPIERRRSVAIQHRAEPPTREPELADTDFEEVVGTIVHLGRTAERLPETFSVLKEESLRDLILFYLNGTYQGAAGGELFNGQGKTDILVRVDDRNVFIGECKIWDGPKKFTRAIDQLLSYMVWRDGKGALVLFVRNKQPTAIIRKAHAEVESQPLLIRDLPSDDPSTRRDFVLRSALDSERWIRMALIPIVIPPPF